MVNSVYTGMMYKPGEHRPLLIFVDQQNSENPTNTGLGAITTEFIQALQQKSGAILVSQTILFNTIYRKFKLNDPKHPENRSLGSLDISSNSWELYEIPQSQFYALIPESASWEYSGKLKTETFSKKDLSNNDESLNGLIQELDPSKNPQPPFSIQEFESIFSDNKEFVWDIYIAGHGTKDELICNFSLKDFQSILKFFTDRIVTGVCIVSSCYAGGTNLSAISMQKQFGKKYASFFSLPNFIIIVTNIEDSPSFASSSNFNDIFSHAASLADGNESNLKTLLQSLNTLTPGASSIHAYANIPQIILPGGIFIQSLVPDASIQVIGKVNAKAKEIEKKSIEIKGKSNVLIYPNVINAPLDISPTSRSDISEEMKISQWRFLPNFNEFFRGFGVVQNIKEIVSEKAESFPTLNGKISSLKKTRNEIFPNLISMGFGDSSNRFLSINVIGSQTQGVINFIRDSFLDINRRKTTKTFLIDKLTGPNDLALLLEAIRALKAYTHDGEPEYLVQSDLEKDIQNKDNITLKNVIIETTGIKFQNKAGDIESRVKTSIEFATDNAAWKFAFDGQNIVKDQPLWDFKKIKIKKHTDKFDEKSRSLEAPLEKKEQGSNGSPTKGIQDVLIEQKKKISPSSREIRIKKAEPSKINQFVDAQRQAWNKLPILADIFKDLIAQNKMNLPEKISIITDESLNQQFPVITNIMNSVLPKLTPDETEPEIKKAMMAEADKIYEKIFGANKQIGKNYQTKFRSFDQSKLSKLSDYATQGKVNDEAIKKYAADITAKFTQELVAFKEQQLQKFPNFEKEINEKIPTSVDVIKIIQGTYRSIINAGLLELANAMTQPATFNTIKKSENIELLEAGSKENNAHFFSWITNQAKQIMSHTRLSSFAQTWLVDSITTNNDILLFLELLRVANNNMTQPQEIENALRPYVNKDITLQNVMLKAENTMFINDQKKPDNKCSLVLGFTLDKKSWICTNTATSQATKGDLWQFKQIDPEIWALQYAGLKKSLNSQPDKTSDNELKQQILKLAKDAGDVLGWGKLVGNIEAILNEKGLSKESLEQILKLVKSNQQWPSLIGEEMVEENNRQMNAYSSLEKLLKDRTQSK